MTDASINYLCYGSKVSLNIRPQNLCIEEKNFEEQLKFYNINSCIRAANV